MYNKEHYKAFMNKLNSWTCGHVFSQPPPSNLCYKYPPPTKTTLIRIAIQLIKEPVFYTQVLHLMNRMNLPPPFIELEHEFPNLKEAYDMEQYEHIFGPEINTIVTEVTNEHEEEDESEVESDDQVISVEINIPQKRKISHSSKRIKIPKFVNPKQNLPKTSSQKILKPEEVFESFPKELKNMTFNIKPVDKLMEQTSGESKKDDAIVIDSNSTGGFGLIFPSNVDTKDQEENEEIPRKQEFITSEQLEENRISTNDQKVLPVFKNYHAGVATHRLYVKNLGKNVEEDDLHFIYKRYITKTPVESDHEYSVRLMQEGRMKGQAFITLQNRAQAQLALNETNGFILKDKPMVVQFAKVPKS